jgi:hypothetical protein
MKSGDAAACMLSGSGGDGSSAVALFTTGKSDFFASSHCSTFSLGSVRASIYRWLVECWWSMYSMLGNTAL